MKNETTRTHVPVDVQPETHINAPVNVHGWCFGLIPANGNWLDDIIDWHKRQFRQAAVARRLAACWNACRSISTEDLERCFGTAVSIDELAGMNRSRHLTEVRAGINAALAAAAEQRQQYCSYPKCTCPFDAPSDPNWCARGLPRGET